MIKEIMFKVHKKVPQNMEEKTTDTVSLVSDMPVKWKGLQLILVSVRVVFFLLSESQSVACRWDSVSPAGISAPLHQGDCGWGSVRKVESALPSLGYPNGRKHAAHRA